MGCLPHPILSFRYLREVFLDIKSVAFMEYILMLRHKIALCLSITIQVEGTTPLSPEDAALLASILCASPLPLPGENGVWRTPQPPAPSSPSLEFGEGISAVFESLGLEATPTHQPSRPAATTKSSPLSANSSPFIPTTSRQASESPVGQNRSNLNGIHQAAASNIPILPSSQVLKKNF